MTPLARRITNELVLPMRKRSFLDEAGLLRKMADIHCFECSDVLDAAAGLAKQLKANLGAIETLAFLPAPRTWIEWKYEGGRNGYLLQDSSGDLQDNTTALLDMATEFSDLMVKNSLVEILSTYPDFPVKSPPARLHHWGRSASGGMILLQNHGSIRIDPSRHRATDNDLTHGPDDVLMLYALLALINSPRVVGRRQHLPHRVLQRDLIRNRASIGRFPLHAWTEIKLEISPPKDLSGERPAEAHLTGQRALHYCRRHIRIRNGRLEMVRAHWRGDPAVGIKQSRYRVTA